MRNPKASANSKHAYSDIINLLWKWGKGGRDKTIKKAKVTAPIHQSFLVSTWFFDKELHLN